MRGKRAKVRKILPDAKYDSVLVSKFANKVMYSGKKEIAFRIIYKAMDILTEEVKKDKKTPLEALEAAIENIKPKLEVRSRRVGGANYQVPMPVRDERQIALAFKWILAAARDSRKHTDFATQLGKELVSAYNKEGSAFKKREDTHRMAEANKAFAQFTW